MRNGVTVRVRVWGWDENPSSIHGRREEGGNGKNIFSFVTSLSTLLSFLLVLGGVWVIMSLTVIVMVVADIQKKQRKWK